MSTNLSGRYSTALGHLDKGTKFEGGGNLSEAVKCFSAGISVLNDILKLETDERKRLLVLKNIDDYTTRSQKLRENQATQHADGLFAHAIECDEHQRRTDDPAAIQQAIDAYFAAAEEYIKVKSKGKRAGDIIGRIEELKAMLIPKTFTSLEDLDSFLPVAPSFIPTSSSSSFGPLPTHPLDVPSTGREKWLGAAKNSAIDPVVPSITVGHGLNELEVAVLRASSVINGKIFMPWMQGEEEREKFRFDHPFCDPDGLLPLSAKQIEAGAEWRRPREFILEGKPTVIEEVNPLCIKQELVSDCSFVCSLCIAAAFEAKFHRQIITGLIYPQNSRHIPIYNAYGKYLVKLFVNGVQRKVVVDDRLPVMASTGQPLCSISSNPNELWVSLVEKAYMKVNGGYDFPGSNSGIDLYALTGWIPEHVYFLEDQGERGGGGSQAPSSSSSSTSSSSEEVLDHRQSEGRAWARIKSAHSFGDCLVTICTGALTPEDEQATGLVPGHAYAVLDVREAGILKMIKVKNPWSRRPWRGRFSSADRGKWTQGLKRALDVADEDFDEMEKHGIFWIEFNDCRAYFKSFFLNWNPSLFSFRIVMHNHWPVSLGPKNDKYFIGDNPQYSLLVDVPSAATKPIGGGSTSRGSTPTISSIWILLSRHVVRKEGGAEGVEGSQGDYLAIHVHRTRGMRRLYSSETPAIRGLYTNDPHILVRIDVDAAVDGADGAGEGAEGTHALPSRGGAGAGARGHSTDSIAPSPDAQSPSYTLVLSQIDKHRDVNYTLTVLGTVPFRLYPSPSPPPHKVDVSGAWSEGTCGGSTSHASFYTNPQYRLVVTGPPAGLHVHIQLLFPKEASAAIYVCKGGSRLDAVLEEDEALLPEHYRSGYCCVEGVLKPGMYTIIASTYRPAMRGPFMCSIRAAEPTFKVSEIDAEALKGFKTNLTGAWSTRDGTAAGCSNHGAYHLNPLFTFFLPDAGLTQSTGSAQPTTSSIRVTARLQVVGGKTAAMNLSFYLLSSGTMLEAAHLPPSLGPKKAQHTSCQGVYVERCSGVAVVGADLAPGLWAIVPSTFDPEELEFCVSLSSSYRSPIAIQRVR